MLVNPESFYFPGLYLYSGLIYIKNLRGRRHLVLCPSCSCCRRWDALWSIHMILGGSAT